MSKRIPHVPKRATILMKNLKLLETKQRGDVGEVVFLQRALCHGLTCSRPYGDHARYDWVVGGLSSRLKRVQVKTVFSPRFPNVYCVACCRGGGQLYKPAELDFLAVYLAPEDVWYIIPTQVFCPRNRLYFRPHPISKDWWRRYREAWWRLGRVPRPADDSPGLCLSRPIDDQQENP